MRHGQARHDHAAMAADFRRRFWVSMILTMPVLALSPLIQDSLGLRTALAFRGESYVLLGFSALIYFYCGQIRYSGGDRGRRRTLNALSCARREAEGRLFRRDDLHAAIMFGRSSVSDRQ